ncbi:NADH-quinone oxidoreductase subunit M, partial [Kangiella sp. HD9-110m-PIT-SAG07]
MLEQLPVLSLLIWIPLLSGVLVLLSPGDRMLAWSQRFGVMVSLLVLALSVWLLVVFDTTTSDFQFIERGEWVPSLNIHYELGVDGIALPLVVLTSLINLLALFGSTASIKFRQTQFIAAVLLLTGAMNGVFLAQDSILFYVFW